MRRTANWRPWPPAGVIRATNVEAAGENAAAAAPWAKRATPSSSGLPATTNAAEGSGESDQSSEQYRARPDAVNERTEHRFENDFGTVVDRE